MRLYWTLEDANLINVLKAWNPIILIRNNMFCYSFECKTVCKIVFDKYQLKWRDIAFQIFSLSLCVHLFTYLFPRGHNVIWAQAVRGMHIKEIKFMTYMATRWKDTDSCSNGILIFTRYWKSFLKYSRVMTF